MAFRRCSSLRSPQLWCSHLAMGARGLRAARVSALSYLRSGRLCARYEHLRYGDWSGSGGQNDGPAIHAPLIQWPFPHSPAVIASQSASV
jgi:hypothetical protein